MTTIVAVKHHDQIAIAGDGQVTMGEKYISKGTAHKIRRIYDDNVIIGFAGGVADAFTLADWLEKKLKAYSGDLRRSAVELAQDWRKDSTLQKLEAMLIAFDKDNLLLISGNGEVIEPDENVVSIGSGGYFAQAAAIAMTRHADEMSATEIAHEAVDIAGSIDIFTNHDIMTDQF
ncbi:MAG TPA: ATP-dependent protease subunit HslV [Lapidilactobacillus dextrinicus]|uniref:ATP-dependent protease subunit HslV n=1 Tax=Lapidilactobacillus dextrinicus TaxID=51664 RepID=A0A921B2Q9_9LACO|nr:ATP-dependent protease subunit HslV [Lapidilactobacillus dextrinicus]